MGCLILGLGGNLSKISGPAHGSLSVRAQTTVLWEENFAGTTSIDEAHSNTLENNSNISFDIVSATSWNNTYSGFGDDNLTDVGNNLSEDFFFVAKRTDDFKDGKSTRYATFYSINLSNPSDYSDFYLSTMFAADQGKKDFLVTDGAAVFYRLGEGAWTLSLYTETISGDLFAYTTSTSYTTDSLSNWSFIPSIPGGTQVLDNPLGNAFQTASTSINVSGADSIQLALVMQVAGNNQTSIALDNIALSAAAVPEPSTYAMIFGLLAGLGFVAKRRGFFTRTR